MLETLLDKKKVSLISATASCFFTPMEVCPSTFEYLCLKIAVFLAFFFLTFDFGFYIFFFFLILILWYKVL